MRIEIKTTLTFQVLYLLKLGICPLWYGHSGDNKQKPGIYIYGFEIVFLGFSLTFGCVSFGGKEIYVKKNTLFFRHLIFKIGKNANRI